MGLPQAQDVARLWRSGEPHADGDVTVLTGRHATAAAVADGMKGRRIGRSKMLVNSLLKLGRND